MRLVFLFFFSLLICSCDNNKTKNNTEPDQNHNTNSNTEPDQNHKEDLCPMDFDLLTKCSEGLSERKEDRERLVQEVTPEEIDLLLLEVPGFSESLSELSEDEIAELKADRPFVIEIAGNPPIECNLFIDHLLKEQQQQYNLEEMKACKNELRKRGFL